MIPQKHNHFSYITVIDDFFFKNKASKYPYSMIFYCVHYSAFSAVLKVYIIHIHTSTALFCVD